jgi:hypothetical protein
MLIDLFIAVQWMPGPPAPDCGGGAEGPERGGAHPHTGGRGEAHQECVLLFRIGV